MIKHARGVQSATRRGRALDDRPLEAWSEAFAALLAVGPTVLATGLRYRAGWVEGLESDAEGLLELLYRAGDDVPVEIRRGARWGHESRPQGTAKDQAGWGPYRVSNTRRGDAGALRHHRPLCHA